MPKINQYLSQETLSNQPSSVNRNIAQEGMTGQNIANLGGAVQQQSFEYMDKFHKADQLRQIDEAVIKRQNGLTELTDEISRDNQSDFETQDKKVREGLDKITREASATIKDKQAKLSFDSEYSKKNAVDYGAFRQILRKKQIERGTAALNTRLNTLQDQYSLATTPEGRMRAMEDISSEMKVYFDHGYLTPKELQKKSQEINKNLVYRDAEINASHVFTELSKGEEGAYKNIGASERLSLSKTVKAMSERQKELRQLKSLGVNEDVMNSLLDDTITPEQIDNIPDDRARELVRESFLKKNKPSIDEVAKGVNGLRRQFSEIFNSDGDLQYGKNVEDLIAFQEDVIKSYNHGIIERGQARAYFDAYGKNINQAIQEIKDSKLGSGTRKLAAMQKMSKAAEEVISVTQKSKDQKEKFINDTVFNFISKLDRINVEDQESVSKAIQSSIKDQILKENPQYSLLEDVPNSSYDIGKLNKIYSGSTNAKSDAKASSSGDDVLIELPNGSQGYVPKSSLSDALKRGAKLVK